MLARIFIFLLGYALTIIGLVYVISYLNLLSIGYNFFEYVNFIFRRIECLYTIIGFILILLSIYLPGGIYELHLWFIIKL